MHVSLIHQLVLCLRACTPLANNQPTRRTRYLACLCKDLVYAACPSLDSVLYLISGRYVGAADGTWGETKPTLQETRVHAKCLRSLPLVRDYFRNYRAKKKVRQQRSVHNTSTMPRVSCQYNPPLVIPALCTYAVLLLLVHVVPAAGQGQ